MAQQAFRSLKSMPRKKPISDVYGTVPTWATRACLCLVFPSDTHTFSPSAHSLREIFRPYLNILVCWSCLQTLVTRLDSAPPKNRVKFMVRLGPEPSYVTSRVSFLPRAESLEQVACLGLLIFTRY